MKKFVEVGDSVVQYDTAHAALTWAAVRFILQVSINDIERETILLESMEHVAHTISMGAIYEGLCLAKRSAAAESLETNLTKLYMLCWSTLVEALQFHDQSKMSMFASFREAHLAQN